MCVYILYRIVKSGSKTYRTLRASDLWSHIMKNTNVHMHTLEDTQICYSLKRDCRNRLLFCKLPRCFSSRNPPSSQPPFFCQCLIGWLGPIPEALSLRASTVIFILCNCNLSFEFMRPSEDREERAKLIHWLTKRIHKLSFWWGGITFSYGGIHISKFRIDAGFVSKHFVSSWSEENKVAHLRPLHNHKAWSNHVSCKMVPSCK